MTDCLGKEVKAGDTLLFNSPTLGESKVKVYLINNELFVDNDAFPSLSQKKYVRLSAYSESQYTII